jgi:GntR family transcriptional repressor for pyruvate dehydrogenase complex
MNSESQKERSPQSHLSSRLTLAETVFGKLREDILAGKLKEGDCLPPQEVLAQQMGVSRTVMREATHKLSSLGLIKSHQGRGTFVCRPDPEVVMEPMLQFLKLQTLPTRDLLETRYHLERVIARLAARRAQPHQIPHLDGIVDTMQRAIDSKDLEQLSKEDLKFHLALAQISNNLLLERILGTIREMVFKFMHAIAHLEPIPPRAVAAHRRILEAVAKNDPEVAEQEMARHILDMVEAIRTHYRFDVDIA